MDDSIVKFQNIHYYYEGMEGYREQLLASAEKFGLSLSLDPFLKVNKKISQIKFYSFGVMGS